MSLRLMLLIPMVSYCTPCEEHPWWQCISEDKQRLDPYCWEKVLLPQKPAFRPRSNSAPAFVQDLLPASEICEVAAKYFFDERSNTGFVKLIVDGVSDFMQYFINRNQNQISLIALIQKLSGCIHTHHPKLVCRFKRCLRDWLRLDKFRNISSIDPIALVLLMTQRCNEFELNPSHLRMPKQNLILYSVLLELGISNHEHAYFTGLAGTHVQNLLKATSRDTTVGRFVEVWKFLKDLNIPPSDMNILMGMNGTNIRSNFRRFCLALHDEAQEIPQFTAKTQFAISTWIACQYHSMCIHNQLTDQQEMEILRDITTYAIYYSAAYENPLFHQYYAYCLAHYSQCMMVVCV